MDEEHTLRHPVVSGLFYPDEPGELERIVTGYLDKVDKKELYERIEEQTGIKDAPKLTPLVVVAPHAGYIFSGKIQAFSYALFMNTTVETAVIIGPSHQKQFKGISVNLDSAYKTPLGNVAVDLDFANALIDHSGDFNHIEEAHLSEHTIEVQLPFLQILMRDIKIVPVLFGHQNRQSSVLLKEALVSVMDRMQKSCAVIVSTDLSHYHPHVEASSLDKRLIQDIQNMDPESFYTNIKEGKSEACGFGGILTGLMLAKERGRGKSAILSYMDSGEVSGDRKKVVGYLSAAMY
jgi:AmmeMemoRadiSam system protein B